MRGREPNLVGIGLYTVPEASRLIGVATTTLNRWLRGHEMAGQRYQPLWKPEINIGDERLYLSFRDLMEARVAARFIDYGLSSQKVRRAIMLAADVVGERPLSTTWLRTDGRAVFLQVATEGETEVKVINLFTKQHVFASVVDRTFRDVEFEGPIPTHWWPLGMKAGVVVDPRRSFGQPIEATTSVPTNVLRDAVKAEGSVAAVAKAWDVPTHAVRKAVQFHQHFANAA